MNQNRGEESQPKCGGLLFPYHVLQIPQLINTTCYNIPRETKNASSKHKTNSLKHRHAHLHLINCLGMSSLFFSGSAKSSLTTSLPSKKKGVSNLLLRSRRLRSPFFQKI